MHLLAIEAPHGAVLQFVLLFGVILLGPLLVERAGIPGIIGLLVGGFAIGPHGLGLIESGNQTIPELGTLGLLYLMFVAGLELDLRLLSEYRKAAVTFGLLTFALPFGAGIAVGFQQGWEVEAALLLGSLLASHTLILYPTIRDAGRGGNPAVASAVGATVLTDTIALVVLAGVAGTVRGSGSTTEVLIEVGIGLVVLVAVGLLLLPRVATAALRLWGGDRAARYLVSVVSFLVMAMLAEVFGIEGIVGAFFAGLALNRLVPNEGPTMERIEFFGSAVFIPVFLVSVGLLLDPAVMFTSETMSIAVLLCIACLGGKALAALATKPLLGFTTAETGVMFVLSAPQAAATLAATLVGFEIGLFGVSVVNAVLVLILVSILTSTLLAGRFVEKVPVPEPRDGLLGEHVLIATRGEGPSVAALHLAERLAAPDGGKVDVVLVHTEDEQPAPTSKVAALERTIFKGALDGEVRTMVDRTIADAIAHACMTGDPSTVIVDAHAGIDPATCAAIAALDGVTVLHLEGDAATRHRQIVVAHDADAGGELPDAVTTLSRRFVAGGAPTTTVGLDDHGQRTGIVLLVGLAAAPSAAASQAGRLDVRVGLPAAAPA